MSVEWYGRVSLPWCLCLWLSSTENWYSLHFLLAYECSHGCSLLWKLTVVEPFNYLPFKNNLYLSRTSQWRLCYLIDELRSASFMIVRRVIIFECSTYWFLASCSFAFKRWGAFNQAWNVQFVAELNYVNVADITTRLQLCSFQSLHGVIGTICVESTSSNLLSGVFAVFVAGYPSYGKCYFNTSFL